MRPDAAPLASAAQHLSLTKTNMNEDENKGDDLLDSLVPQVESENPEPEEGDDDESGDGAATESPKDTPGNSEQGPATEVEDDKEKEIDSRVSKATAAASENLKKMLGLLKQAPGKLEELKAADPELHSKLQKAFPEEFQEAPKQEQRSDNELSTVLKSMLELREDEIIAKWGRDNKIPDGDLKAHTPNMKTTINVLLKNGLAATWDEGVRIAGEMAFPSVKTAPADTSRRVPPTSPSNRIPAKKKEYSEIDEASMRATGVSAEEWESFQSGDYDLGF